MVSTYQLKSTLPKILYTYWDNLPIIENVDSKVVSKFKNNRARDYIIKAISYGVEDEIKNQTKKRHALSANEIKTLFETIYDFEIKKSNLYYHIEKLVEFGLLKEVAIIQKGNILTSYYGRTSKLIFFDMGEDQKDASDSQSSPENNVGAEKTQHPSRLVKLIESKHFHELLQRFNLSPEQIEMINQLSLDLRSNPEGGNTEFMEWIITKEEEFRGLDIDLLDINYLFLQILNQNPKRAQLLDTLRKGFEIN